MKKGKNDMDFYRLSEGIVQIDKELSAQTSRAINISLTLRNWLIGWYIEEYERSGIDRAEYGEKLMERLAEVLTVQGVSRCERRELYRYRRFYLTYPQIVESLTPQLLPLTKGYPLHKVLSQAHASKDADSFEAAAMPPRVHSQPHKEGVLDGHTIVSRLSFTHIVELLAIEEGEKRLFYEVECIRGNWSVRELKRQIGSLYYERSALSIDKAQLARIAQKESESSEYQLAIRDPYVFEFLGLVPAEVMSESHLEEQLLGRLQHFLLELGNGFCFEASQKRIPIGEKQYFVDMVFYHRILKCHVLVDLKLAEFNHENIGQLNTYVNWYKKHMMTEGDNAPIGILLCSGKDYALVEYALAGMDNHLFVSRYQLELPSKEAMERFIKEQEKAIKQEELGRQGQ